MNIIQAFQATLNPQKEIRDQGEAFLDQLPKNPQVLPQVLEIALVRSNNEQRIRQAALLCFGRTLGKMDNINVINDQTLQVLSTLLVEIIKTETCVELKGAAATAISMFAESLSQANKAWGQYFPTILELMKSPTPIQQMIAMTALSASTCIQGYDSLAQFGPQIIQFCVGLLNTQDVNMISTVFDFLSSAIDLFESIDQNIQYVQSLVVPLCGTLMNLLKGSQFDIFDDCALEFAEMIQCSLCLIQGNEMNVLNQFFSVVTSFGRKESQQSAMEIVISVLISNAKMFKQNPAIVNTVVLKLFEWLASIDDEGARCILDDEDMQKKLI